MNVPSNFSAEEEYRVTGTVTGDRLVALLDAHANADRYDSIEAHMQEAYDQFPDEDFLEGHKQRLIDLRRNLRGANREALDRIIEALDDLAMTTFYAADYGRSELRLALKTIRGE